MRLTWYRMYVPFQAVNDLSPDVSVTFRSGGGRLMLDPPPMVKVADADEVDLVVSQRASSYEGLGLWRRWGSRPGLRTVYENDDDVFSITPENTAAYDAYKEGTDIREATLRYCRTANLVTTTSPHLGDRFREMLDNRVPVEVLPNYVPAWVLDLPRDTTDRRMRLGWAGGSSHGRDIFTAVPSVRRFMKRFPGWDLYLNGMDWRDKFGCPSERSFHVPWIHVTDHPEVYYRAIDFDIGICPLLDTRFSRSKCIDAGMRVLTQDGVLEARALAAGMRVWHEDAWREVEAVERGASRPGVLITTEHGNQLRLTPEHRMLTASGWEEARNIGPGTVLLMEPERGAVRGYVTVPWPADGRMSRAAPGSSAAKTFSPYAFLTATDGPVLTITPRWGRLLGAFAGDGNVGQGTIVQISCDGQDQDWIDLLTKDWRAAGLNPRTEAVTMFGGKVLRRRGVRVASAHLVRVLESLGVAERRPNGRPKRVVCVPDVVWQSPLDVITEFLAAYFEADGHCTGSGVGAVSKSEVLIRDIQRLLLLFGIQGIVQPREHKSQTQKGVYWHIRLRKDQARLFEKKIGFRSERKRAKLAVITGRRDGSGAKPVKWEQAVVSVTACVVEPVDIQVEGSVFALAGFVSHNSHVKALEYFSRGIPVVASDVEPYRRFIDHGVDGFLCKTDHEWLRYLSLLASDEALRLKMGEAAKEKARRNTIEEHWVKWVNAYTMLFPAGWRFKG